MVNKIDPRPKEHSGSRRKTLNNMKNTAILAGIGGGSLSLLSIPGYKGNIKSPRDINQANIDIFVKTLNDDEAKLVKNSLSKQDINQLNNLVQNVADATNEKIKDARTALRGHQEKIFSKVEAYLPIKSPILHTLKWTSISAATGAIMVGVWNEVIKRNDK